MGSPPRSSGRATEVRARLLTLFRDLPFRRKLFISYLVVVVVPVMALGTYSFWQAKALLRRQAIGGLETSLERMGQEIGSWVDQSEAVMNSVAYSTRMNQIFNNLYGDLLALSEDYRGYLGPFFDTIVNLRPDIKQITFYSKCGLPEYGTSILAFGRIAGNAWALDQLIYRATAWISEAGDLLAVHGMRDLYSGRDLGALMIRFQPERIPWISLILPVDGARILVATEKGEIIASRGTSEGEARSILRLADSEEKGRRVTLDGSALLLFSMSVPGSPWKLYAATPPESLTLDAGWILWATLLVALLCILLLVLLTWLFSATLVRRIDNLNHKMTLVAQGDLSVEVGRDSSDEIGDLAHRFGGMLSKVNELMKEVREREASQREAELRALQAQINPHFLYNTLSMIHWKALEVGAQNISSIAMTLSKFYRTALNKGRNLISVRDELENTRAYIDIQLLMHDMDFAVSYAIDEAACRYVTLNLILQPIVENAIDHGLDGTEKPERSLRVAVREKGSLLEFVIQDNGAGMDEITRSRALSGPSRGYGLKNVNDRIKLLFGEAFGIQLESEPGKGTVVTVRVPKQAPA